MSKDKKVETQKFTFLRCNGGEFEIEDLELISNETGATTILCELDETWLIIFGFIPEMEIREILIGKDIIYMSATGYRNVPIPLIQSILFEHFHDFIKQ